MAIEGVHTLMSPLQFARARSASRAVETSEAATRQAGGSGRGDVRGVVLARPGGVSRPERLVGAATFHWSYRSVMVNGKSVAKRVPQLADTKYWSFNLNRLG